MMVTTKAVSSQRFQAIASIRSTFVTRGSKGQQGQAVEKQ